MVLQSPLPRDLYGDCRLCHANPVFEERPVLRTLLRGAVFLHRGRACVLLRSDICHLIQDDSTGRKDVLSSGPEVDPMDICHVRCHRNCGADTGCRSRRISIFEPEESEHIQQHFVGRSCLPGFRLLHLCDAVKCFPLEEQKSDQFKP